jgi:hypothetical protein
VIEDVALAAKRIQDVLAFVLDPCVVALAKSACSAPQLPCLSLFYLLLMSSCSGRGQGKISLALP